jgi:indole-3-acetate monooxygenase
MLLLFPRDQVRILDTWSVCGLRGTGSHDVRFSRAWCPDWRTTVIDGASRPNAGDTIFRIPLLEQGGLYIAAVVLGIAQAALDDVIALAGGGKRPAFSCTRLSASTPFQERLGDAFMQLQSARGLLYAQADAAWSRATRHVAASVQERAVARATVSTVMAASVAVVDTAYSLAGGSALYESSTLQRRFRDIHAAAQHAYASRHHFGALGGVLAGEPPDPALG